MNRQDLEHEVPVFSLTRGEVWASWYDGRGPVNLGKHEAVMQAMHDFLRQSQLGRRLLEHALGSAEAQQVQHRSANSDPATGADPPLS